MAVPKAAKRYSYIFIIGDYIIARWRSGRTGLNIMSGTSGNDGEN